MERTIFNFEGRVEKLSSGPIMFPNPGPTTAIEVIPADTEVRKSYPCKLNTIETNNTPDINNTIINITELNIP